MINNQLRSLIKKANKINGECKPNELYNDTTPKNKKIQFRDFKLYFALLEKRDGSWFLVDIFSVGLLPILAFIAMMGNNESTAFKYFKIITIVGAIFFIFKVFFIKSIIHSMKYLFFKNWIKNISFTVIGWDKVYNNDEILNEENWYQQCSIFIKLDPKCPLITKTLIEAAVVVFIDNAKWVQHNFYSETKYWEIHENKLVGGANNSVLGYVQRFIKDDLNSINKLNGGITSIEITVNEKMRYVCRAETSSTGI